MPQLHSTTPSVTQSSCIYRLYLPRPLALPWLSQNIDGCGVLAVVFRYYFQKNRFLKAQPAGFWGLLGFGLYWVFRIFVFERAVGKFVGWFSSSAYLWFRFTSTLDYLKICKFITHWSFEAVNIKISFIIAVMTNWNWIKFGAGFCWFFQRVLLKKPGGFWGAFLGVTRVSEPCFLIVRDRHFWCGFLLFFQRVLPKNLWVLGCLPGCLNLVFSIVRVRHFTSTGKILAPL